MASPVTESHSPISSPPPVHLKSSAPPPPTDPPPPVPQQKNNDEPGAAPPEQHPHQDGQGPGRGQQSRIPDPHAVPKRKPLSIPTIDDMRVQNSPLSPVRIDTPSTMAIPQASSAQIEDARTSLHSLGLDDQQRSSDGGDNRRDGSATNDAGSHPLPPLPLRVQSLAAEPSSPLDNSAGGQYPSYRANPVAAGETELDRRIPQRKESLAAAHEVPIQDTGQETGQQTGTDPNEQQDQATVSSGSSVVSVQQDNGFYQPLQYHHQPFHEHLKTHGGNRASKSTIMTGGSDSSSTEQLNNGGYLAPSRGRSGLGIPRPSSAYSDFVGRGRTQSPHMSPYLPGRNASTHSLTPPDTRPSSFVDLINAPYPQPAPAPAMLRNSNLRPSVGNNASLLSHKRTFEMYLANVKKTNDPGAQYEFAVFMVASAQELGDDEETKNSEAIPKADLFREAKLILQRLSDRSYPYAQYYLGDGLATGLFNKGKPDHDKAFPLFVAASKHGHAESGYRAGLCYEFGWGCRQDGAKAVQFFRHAASKNHPGAMSRLGRACLAGEMGLTKRYREGITWLKRAAESADPQYNAAPYELGVLHETGYGDDVFPDESYAAQLFTRAAELGHSEASYRMGDAYEHGKLGCPRDPALSVHFYTESAQLGHALAMMALCAWFMVGAEPVLEKDETEAFEWAKRAAECGLAKAEYAVGYFTEMGIGCRRDALEANVWYVRAADSGDERAKHRIAAIRAAASGEDPNSVARRRQGSTTTTGDKQNKGKRFGIF